MIRAVIFDLDGTLYDFNAAHARAFGAVTAYACDFFGLQPEEFINLHKAADGLLKMRCGGGAAIHNRLIRYQLMLETMGKPISFAPALSKLYWSTLLLWMKPAPGLTGTLQRLREMGLRLGVGTNMTADWQYEKLERLGILPLIDFLVTSEEAGAEKPEKRLFELCAEKAHCPPGECVFVGDSLRGDAIGARDAGMRGIWLHTEGEEIPGITRISSLSELPELLTKEC